MLFWNSIVQIPCIHSRGFYGCWKHYGNYLTHRVRGSQFVEQCFVDMRHFIGSLFRWKASHICFIETFCDVLSNATLLFLQQTFCVSLGLWEERGEGGRLWGLGKHASTSYVLVFSGFQVSLHTLEKEKKCCGRNVLDKTFFNGMCCWWNDTDLFGSYEKGLT